jgi:hypothetical protein
MPIAKLKYLVANGDLVTRNFTPCIRINYSFVEMFLCRKNQGQSKWQEAVESYIMSICIICTVCEVLEKMKQGFKDGSCHQRTEKTHRNVNWRV